MESEIDNRIQVVTEHVEQSLRSVPWSDEVKAIKRYQPIHEETMMSFDWEIPAWVSTLALNREFSTPLDEITLKGIFASICDKITGERLLEVQKAPRKTFTELMTTEYPDNRFAIDPFFEQGTMNMVSAPPNTWKSWLFFLMAYNIANGAEFLEKFKTEKAKVLIVNEEDTERLIADRFRALSITQSDLGIYFRIANGAKITSDYCKLLIEECRKDDITVIMFDSLRSLHDADENSSTAMQPVMDNLKMLTREGITVIFTHHHKKKNPFDRGDNAESSRGSSAINAAISGHISLEEVEREDGKFIVVRHLKSKVTQKIEPFEIKISIEGDRVSFVHKGGHDDATVVAEKTRQDAYEFMQKYPDHWVNVKELVNAKIGNDKYVRMALMGMRANGLVECASVDDLATMGVKVKGAKNSKFYKISKVVPEEAEEGEKELSATWGVFDNE